MSKPKVVSIPNARVEDEPAATWVDIAKLTPWKRNPRKNDDNVKRVMESIKRFGFSAPIVARKADGEVIAGHTRLKAAEALGMTSVPVRYLDLDPADAHLLALADNRLNELSPWDVPELQSLLGEYGLESAALAGWSSEDIEKMASDLLAAGAEPAEVVEDEVPEPPKVAITKLGDVWELGEHVLVCGDCRDPNAIRAATSGAPIGTVITDPPYGMAFRSNYRDVKHDAIAGDGDSSLLLHACGIEATHSKYIWCRWDNVGEVPKPKSLITWVKNNWSMGDLEHEHGRQTEVALFYPGPDHEWGSGRPSDVVNHARTGNELHPTQKPVSLLAEVIGWTKGLIFDPFMGSGTTLIACEQLGRRCFGVELSPNYCDVIVARWEALTGKKATLRAS